jgi:hypothetical protein
MKVISRKQLPAQPHWSWKALTAYLALEHFNAPGWLWGVVGCIFTLALIGYIYCWCSEKETRINL